jgi:peptide/nickel transport system permease protein
MTAVPETGLLPLAVRRPSSSAAWLRRNRDLWLPTALLILVILACYVGPWLLALPDPLWQELDDVKLPLLSPEHPLGTDDLGRDTLSRLLHGGRTSIEVGIAANVIGLFFGGIIGVIAGFVGGVTDTLISRALDVLVAFPSLVLLLVVASFLGPSELNVILAIGFFSIPGFARLARAATIRLRGLTYISAAQLGGQKDGVVMLRHIVPNVLPQLLTYSVLHVGIVIVIEASLSFLGVGVPPPAPSWGTMISSGQLYLSTDPQLVLVPSAMLFVTVLLFNLVGDAVRERWGGTAA